MDVLIAGGGIVGASVARDAAMRGLSTLLVERRDFASGSSSRSSRLLHGGLRYLAQGRLGLVREAGVEKTVLHRIAPHLAAPLPFLFPTYRGTGWPRWKLALGVRLYDVLCGGRNLGRSSTLPAAGMRSRLPGLAGAGLTGGVRYFDGLTNDARLVIDTLLSAVRAGGEVRNYTSFLDAERRGDAWLCRLRGEEGEREVASRVVVNAAGCWSPGIPHSRVRLRITKGSHIVVDGSRLPLPEAVVMTDGPRILFAIPWGERVIVGTTDTDYQGPLDEVSATPPEIAYLLEAVNRTFPDAGLEEGDVMASWAGLRPLLAGEGDRKGAPSDVSRRHEIRMPEPGWFDVAGGKLTTARLMAEQTVDRIGRYLGVRLPPCRTADTPLVEGLGGILPPPVTREVVERACRGEWARYPEDVLLRRTGWAWYHPRDAGLAARVAGWMAAR